MRLLTNPSSLDDGGEHSHRLARTIIKDNRLFDPPDLDGRMPRVSKWER
jgi:hypothetical protein